MSTAVSADAAVPEPERLARSQIGEAAAMLTRAFWDDPLTRYLVPDPVRWERLVPGFMAACVRYGHLYGEVLTTPGGVDGVAIWLPPGRTTTTFRRMLRAGLITAGLRFGWPALQRLGAFAQFDDRLHRGRVPDRCWYLFVLGVEPSRQGTGIGSALLRPVIARADAAGLPCVLDTLTEANRRFYEKRGFSVIGEGGAPAGDLHVWLMERPPTR